MTPCNCEHIKHEYGFMHTYFALRTCTKRAQYVGLVCDECAEHCVKEYLI